MNYTNPVLFFDYSDPDVIRHGEYYYLVASSFNFVPGVPVLRSKNLVEWEHVNYVIKKLPFERFDSHICLDDGAWAPAIREHGGKFYCLIPFPDEGIFVAQADSPEGEWSPLRLLIKGCGIIDPCPVWEDGKCYVATGFARSRMGFNSVIGLYEVTPDLTQCLCNEPTIIYDGHNDNPIIEGPKFYKRDGYFYILAPAGSVKTGWQVALRSKSVYGPYESKVILMQGDSPVNGPHQGALIDTPNGDFFMHFQDRHVYGRIVHLQPVVWENGWPICGKRKYDGIAGTPVDGGAYPVDIKTDARLTLDDDFMDGELAPQWQFPANPTKDCGSVGGGLKLNCVGDNLPPEKLIRALTAKIMHPSFKAACSVELHFESDGDEFGFGLVGKQFALLTLSRQNGKIRVSVGDGLNAQTYDFEGDKFEIECNAHCFETYRLFCSFKVNGKPVGGNLEVTAGVWVGARHWLFARNRNGLNGSGYALVHGFTVDKI